jgi:hypothetical protein
MGNNVTWDGENYIMNSFIYIYSLPDIIRATESSSTKYLAYSYAQRNKNVKVCRTLIGKA